MHEDDPPDLYEELERRALFDLPAEEPGEEEPPDLVGSLSGAIPPEESADLTLGGYIEKHNRVPAFEGTDGQPYTVDIDVEADDDGNGYVAFLVFIRWAATGAGIMDHVESPDLARSDTEAGARQSLMELSLYEVKAELDAAIARREAREE